LNLHFNNNNNSYKNINLLLDFNELQQRKFLDIFITKSEKTKKINSKDFLNGQISE
jgi:hypothetical protein